MPINLNLKKILKNIVFWTHLVAGIVCGAVIAIMSATGVPLAFQNEIIAWAEGDLRKAAPPQPDSVTLPVNELLKRAHEQKPGFTPATFTINADKSTAYVLSTGGRGATICYQNPYNGELRDQGAPAVRSFMNTMFVWHRWLGLGGEARAAGKAITGACNAAFVLLVVTGFYLWWPRSWKWKQLRASTVLQTRLGGSARDWNWHNAIGFWCAPVLLVLTITALPISYQWSSDFIYRIFNEEIPVRKGPPPAAAAPLPSVAKPSADARPLTPDALLARAQAQLPGWEQITMRTPATPGSRETRRGGAHPAGAQAPSLASAPAAMSENTPPVTLTVRESSRWPRTATVQAHFDPYTGDLLRRDTFGDNTPARRLRVWTRFLHTGEALGWPGQLVAALASLGALVLCYTGFALTWRRFFGRKQAPGQTPLDVRRPQSRSSCQSKI